MKFRFSEAVPRYAFPDTPIPIKIELIEQYSLVPNSNRESQPLQLTLVDSDMRGYALNSLMTVEKDSQKCFTSTGTCLIKISISKHEKFRRFCLRVEGENIDTAHSKTITIVDYKLKIFENPKNPFPEVFFKDEGGRDHCIDMFVELQDRHGRQVRHSLEIYKLSLTLLYENLTLVAKQDILKISSESRLIIDKSGIAHLRVRLEEVSKNHQKQAFSIQVEAKGTGNNANKEIAIDISKPVCVMSKRIFKEKSNQKIRKRKFLDDKMSSYGTPRSSFRSASNGVSTNWEVESARSSISNWQHNETNIKNLKSCSSFNDRSEIGVDSSPNASLQFVEKWVITAKETLVKLKWELIGNEKYVEEGIEETRPMYNMQNPNPLINSLMNELDSEVFPHISNLKKTLDEDINMPSKTCQPKMPAFVSNSSHVKDSNSEIADLVNLRRNRPASIFEDDEKPRMENNVPSFLNLDDLPPTLPSFGFRNLSFSALAVAAKLNSINIDSYYDTDLIEGINEHVDDISPSSDSVMTLPEMKNASSTLWGDMIRDNPPMISQKSIEGIFTDGILKLNSTEESKVYFILALMFKSEMNYMLGMPAFDERKKLIGFYKEVEGRGETTLLVFDTLESIHGLCRRENEIYDISKKANALLANEQKEESREVFTLTEFPSIEEMKKTAGEHFWKISFLQ